MASDRAVVVLGPPGNCTSSRPPGSPVPLGPNERLREASSSLHSMFLVTREILRRHGPGVARAGEEKRLSIAYLAVAVLNGWLRPLLTVWLPGCGRTNRPARQS